MNKKQMRELIKAHLEAEEPECRWCFAIDRKGVKGNQIAQYDFPDGMLLHYSCPRCGGEYTVYAEIFGRDYLKERIYRIHPELKDKVKEEQLDEIVRWSFPTELPCAPKNKLYTAEILEPPDESAT